MKENEKDEPQLESWRGTLTLFLSYDRQIKAGKVILTQQEYAVQMIINLIEIDSLSLPKDSPVQKSSKPSLNWSLIDLIDYIIILILYNFELYIKCYMKYSMAPWTCLDPRANGFQQVQVYLVS